MTKLKVLVTGVGRCGTTYMAHLLTKMGIPCGHEAIFTVKGLEEAKNRLKNPELISFSQCSEDLPLWTDPWEIQADSSYLAAPFLNNSILKNTKVIRILRNPLEVIASYVFDAKYFANDILPITKPFQDFIKFHLPIVYDNNLSPINRAALYYIEWNNLIQKNNKNIFTYKIESNIKILTDHLNLPYANIENKKINSWNYQNRPKLTYLDIEEPYRSILKEEYKYFQKVFI